MLVPVSQTTEHNMPQDHNLQTLLCPGLLLTPFISSCVKQSTFDFRTSKDCYSP